MSYILDALKKSDQERKRGDVPGLQTVHIPMATAQAPPWGLYVFVVFLLLALAFVIGMMVVGENTEGMASEQLGSSTQQVNLPPLIAEIPESKAAEQKELAQAERRETQLAVRVERDLKPPQIQKTPEKSVIDKQSRGKAKVSVQELSDVLYLHELPDYRQQSIPELVFAGHVYSSTPASRSIIINNSAMSEGDNIMPGLKVELITSNGVVLKFQDTLFKMDILQDWSFE